MFVDCSKYDFKGSVKEVEAKTVSLFEQSDGEIVENLESVKYYRYDKSKNLIEFSEKFPKKFFSKTIKSYDSENRITEITHFNENSLMNKSEFFYDSSGRLSKQKIYDKKGVLISVHRPSYTKEGFRVEKIEKEPIFFEGNKVNNGQISFRITPEIRTSFSINNVHSYKTIHDKNEKILEAAFYNKIKIVLGKIFVVYDESGNPLEISVYGDNRSFLPSNSKNWQKFLFPFARKLENFLSSFYSAYKLSLAGKYQKAFRCLVYGSPFDLTTFEYGEKGKLKEIKHFSSLGFSNGKKIFEYDEKGNKIEEISYSENSEKITHQQNYEYEYDSKDNWIKKTTVFKHPIFGGTIMERIIVFSRKIKYD